MRSFYILPLHFTTPVHFGSAGYGGGLEMAGMTCPADTLFSALCVEAVRLGGDALAALTAKAERGDIAFSDLLPCRWEAGEWQWYLPKPVLSMPVKAERGQTLKEAREASSFRKKSKKRAFLRASELSLYIDDLRFGENSLEEEPTFASLSVDTHYNGRLGRPYAAGSFSFAENAGLYVLLRLADEKDLPSVLALFHLLGLSGIGGRRSSGMGKFELGTDPILVSKSAEEEDTGALYELLMDTQAATQMTISCLLPKKEEIEAGIEVKGLWMKRSGLTWTPGMESAVKEKSIYMLPAGSTLSCRLAGRIADVATPAVGHPVYRYGKGFFLGVPT